MAHKQLIDKHNRKITYLRISITDRCNLNCLYCMPKLSVIKLPHHKILKYEEILRITQIAVDLGVSKVKITGGEPLVRKGVYKFLTKLNQIKGIDDISITSNGVLLKENIKKLKNAGIKRVNISLDTLDKNKYKQITGYNYFDKVWEGIQAALGEDFWPIKINMVVLKGINDNDIEEMAKLSLKYPFEIRFIEYMPIGINTINHSYKLLAPEIKKIILKRLGELIPVKKNYYDGPAEKYKFKKAIGKIGFITPLSNHFCTHCNRIRLTANGLLKPCLLSEKKINIIYPIRSGCSNSQLADIIMHAVQEKKLMHNLTNKQKIKEHMSLIGG